MKNDDEPLSALIAGTRAAFASVGFGMAGWAPLVPYAKARLGLDAGVLGLLLLCIGIGSFATMPFAGAMSGRFGCRKLIFGGCLCLALSLPALATVDTIGLMAVALLLFGAAMGAADVAMNVQAVTVERASGRAMMSGFHAFFSLGGIAGAGGVSLALWLGASPAVAALVAGLVIIGGLLPFGAGLLPYAGTAANPAEWRLFTPPTGLVLGIGGLCFIAFLTEGAVLDWSSVFLTGVRQMRPAAAGAAYAVFSAAMAGGRLGGDALMRQIGPRRLVAGGAICAIAGLSLVVCFSSIGGAYTGFGLVGLGVANLVPALYSALGRQRIMPANLAVSAVSTLGYAGILAGPALIGLIAHALSLSTAFVFVGGLLFVVAVCSRIVFSPKPRDVLF